MIIIMIGNLQSLLEPESALQLKEKHDDDDELMLNVLRCHLTY